MANDIIVRFHVPDGITANGAEELLGDLLEVWNERERHGMNISLLSVRTSDCHD